MTRQADDLTAARKWTHAKEAWEKVAEAYPQYRKIPVRLVETWARSARMAGRADHGYAVTSRYLDERGRHPDILREHAECANELGAFDEAVRALEEYIALRRRPKASAFKRLALVLAGNGQFEAALAAIHRGLQFHEGSELLTAAERTIRWDYNSHLPPVAAPRDDNEHLFGYSRTGTSQAVAAATIRKDPANDYVKQMLGFEQCYSADKTTPFEQVDTFVVWGSTSAPVHDACRAYAKRFNRHLLSIEYGFVSSLDIAARGSQQHSIILCPGPVYYDSTQNTDPVIFLNSQHVMEDSIVARAANCISRLVSTKVTKYNHAPIYDMRVRLPLTSRPKILLVDQRKGDKSVSLGLASAESFQRMLEYALSMEDHDIIIKLHPDAISGKYGSYLGDLITAAHGERVQLVDYDVNPFSLFEVVDKVFVATSQLGFEAAFAGLEVFCFGAPFYSGWGFTRDMVAIPRRKRTRSIEEVFATYYLKYSRYHVPNSKAHELEDLIEYIVASRAPPESSNAVVQAGAEAIRILMIVPSERMGASGRYMQTLSEKLVALGDSVTILCEGGSPVTINGVAWRPIEFDGMLMSKRLRSSVEQFEPQLIYVNGVRSRAQRIALEAKALTGARLVTQAEDDDVDVYLRRAKQADPEHLTSLDQPSISMSQMQTFLARNDWEQTISVLMDPDSDRWIEPVLRMLTNRSADAHTAIWMPFAERLAAEYGKPTLVVPPVARAFDYSRQPAEAAERSSILSRHAIDDDRVVFFLGGSIYDYSNDFAVFLRSLGHLAESSGRRIALVVAGRSPLPVEQMLATHLPATIQYAHIASPSDATFMELLRACDVCCSPGLETRFNKYRLPSRLVKAMAMGKPVLTCTTGFGESLTHGHNAALTSGNDPEKWAEQMEMLLSADRRQSLGKEGREFAIAHFEAGRVADHLNTFFRGVLDARGKSPALGLDMTKHVRRDPPPAPPMSTGVEALVGGGAQTADVVVHVGAGGRAGLSEYVRNGATRVTLVEKDPALASALSELSNVGTDSIVVRRGTVVTDTGETIVEGGGEVGEVPTIAMSEALAVFSGARSGLLVVDARGAELPLIRAANLDQRPAVHGLVVRTAAVDHKSEGHVAHELVDLLHAIGFDASVVRDSTDETSSFVTANRRTAPRKLG